MFKCKKCKGENAPTDSLNSTQVHVGENTFQDVLTFQYLGDMIGELDGCVDATIIHITAAWKGFRQLLPIITNYGILLRNQLISSAPVLEAVCYMVAKHGQHLAKQCNLTFAYNGMVCWICGVQLEQHSRTEEGKISRTKDDLSPGGIHNFAGAMLLQKTSKISTSGKNLLMNRQNGKEQLCQEKYKCKECNPSEID